MKLYVIKISKFDKKLRLTHQEYDVIEKDKVYIAKERMFLKDNIGKLSGKSLDEVVLLENDIKAACIILKEKAKEELKELNNKLFDKIDEIRLLESYVADQEK